MSKSALLVMDVQPGILANLGPAADGYLKKINELVDAAHDAKILVIFVVVRFREGYPEVHPNSKTFGMVKERGPAFHETEDTAQPAIKAGPNDFTVTKRRVSAFTGSDLEVLLRAQGIRDLVLCGIATSGVVLSTVREAADKDYGLTVIADACYDGDPEVHNVLVSKIFPRQAEVVTIEDWMKSAAEVKS